MDPEVSVLLDCADWRGLLESQVQVELSERFNRQTDADLERHIEDVWKERVSKEPWLFNGAKFRLHSFCLASPRCPSSSFAASNTRPAINHLKSLTPQSVWTIREILTLSVMLRTVGL
ncbi:hypothetical protein INR49_020722 [Caranx melampygus]|nr:hypothetical protein INR49_020722 [Caranx melampygus]